MAERPERGIMPTLTLTLSARIILDAEEALNAAIARGDKAACPALLEALDAAIKASL